ncbi:MAG: AAA family ATPase, partial [Caldilineaceae bacterium]|nr:AAA family ATPase [Caldilineaceae bacterium]
LPPPHLRVTGQAAPAQLGNQRRLLQGAPIHNLPAPLMPLVGREEETVLLGQLLADPTVRLLTVMGPGGVGKTHLALATAAEQVTHFRDGVFWVELAAVDSVAALLVAVVQALQLGVKDDDALQQQVVAFLRSKRVLLLLDNFEHLLAAVDLVVDLLKQLPDLTIMVTSRVRLQVQSEQLFPITGLTFPTAEGEQPAKQTNDSAPALFVQQARRLRPDFKPQSADWSAIHQICRAVQGMPLGILLAAAWVRDYTPTAIACQIEANLDFLTSEWRDVPARHQSMRAVFDHSWHLLSARAQMIFQQLAIFRGGFTAAAAEAITSAALPELIVLVDRSLVQRSLGKAAATVVGGRFVLHELARQYAAEKLAANRSLHYQTALYHAAYFADFLEKQYANMGTARESTALALIDPEVENIAIAWHWAITEEQIDLLQRALPALNHYCRARRRHRFGDRALGFAATKIELLVAIPSPPLAWLHFLATLYRERAFFRWMASGWVESEQLLQQTMALLTQLEKIGENVDAAQADTLRELGRITAQQDRVRARDYFAQSLAIYRTLGDAAGLVHILAFLGDLAWNMGDYRAARRWIEQGLAERAAVADPELHANLLNLLGIVALHQGQLDEAEQRQREALLTAQSVGRIGRHEKFHLGVTLIWSGRFADGYRLLSERIQQEDSEGMRGALAAAYIHFGEAALHLGDGKQARHSVLEGLTIANVHKSPRLIGDTLRILGQIELFEGHDDAASAALLASVAALRTIDQLGSLGWSLATLSYAAQRLGAHSAAKQHAREALQIAHNTGALFPLLMALPACALLYRAENEPTRAQEIYRVARRYPYIAASHWFGKVVHPRLGQLTDTLPPLRNGPQPTGDAAAPWRLARCILQEW